MFVRNFLVLALLISLSITTSYSQGLIINEVMANNQSVISDEDGDFVDWIELYNNSNTAINLNAYGLSDEIGNPLKWQFPDTSINSQEYMLIYASSKNRSTGPADWETVINWGDVWNYLPGTYEPAATWKDIGFDDSQWQSGPSGFGYGDNDDATIISNVLSIYIRKTFTITDVSNINEALLHIDFDDGFVAYLNGIEIARENMGIAGTPPAFDAVATTFTEPQMTSGASPFLYTINDFQSILNNGENILAIQVHNVSQTSSDITLIPFLTFGMNTSPIQPVGIAAVLQGSLPRLHTNFKISASGETITLCDSTGTILNQITTGVLPADISIGHLNDSSSLYIFYPSSPGSANNPLDVQLISGEVVFSLPSGMYSGNQYVSLFAAQPGDSIYFTTDGSNPSLNSFLYSDSLELTSTTVLRARIINQNAIPGKIITNTYLINEQTTLPIISIATDPENFWNIDTGMYVMGNNAQVDFPYFNANFWHDWERPVHLEYFDESHSRQINMNAGVKIFGGWSRGFPQKSLSVFARSKYGDGSIKHKLFTEKPIEKFESIVLRNSGNDNNSTMFRDGLLTGLLKGVDIDRQAYEPAILFINGSYWGIQNIREKVNEHFINNNHPWVSTDQLDLLEFSGTAIHGDPLHYAAMISFIENNSLAISANYDYLKSQIDINEYLNYQVAQIYFNNKDWPGNNIKFWRPKTSIGKWRWILYDTDFGFGTWENNAYTYNTLEYALDANGPEWPNPPWSTYLFRSMISNNSFKVDLVNRFADLLNTNFKEEIVTQQLDSIKQKIEGEIPSHNNKWNAFDINGWNYQVQIMRNFALNRPGYLRTYINNEFDLYGLSTLDFDVTIEGAGLIQVNSLLLTNFPWEGIYFHGNPIDVKVIAKPGYKFVRWLGIDEGNNPILYIDPPQNANIYAQFELDPNQDGTVVINEINYKSHVEFDSGDWIELYNSSTEMIDISGWQFKDSDNAHAYIIPENTIMASDAYLVICKDTIAFKSHYPLRTAYLGQLDFGLSSAGEAISLYDADENLIDFVEYGNTNPWPTVGGTGSTLELINPYLDNALASSWHGSGEYSTPCALNNSYQYTDDDYGVEEHHFAIQDLSIHPNPFNKELYIDLFLDTERKVSVKVFNINGTLIKNISNVATQTGKVSLSWDGTNNSGKRVAPGVYIIEASSQDWLYTQKAIMLN